MRLAVAVIVACVVLAGCGRPATHNYTVTLDDYDGIRAKNAEVFINMACAVEQPNGSRTTETLSANLKDSYHFTGTAISCAAQPDASFNPMLRLRMRVVREDKSVIGESNGSTVTVTGS